MGWDDNGLPTERRVQNYFHVRCDPTRSYEPGLKLEQAAAAQRSEPPRQVSRSNFIELCREVTLEDEKAFLALWQRIGLSVDWNQQYATIDDRCRHLAELSFLDLYQKGHIYNIEAPTMWDVDFQTAVAQAELEDRPKKGAFHDIEFGVEGTGASFVISTTRPELLPACVGVTAHPDDHRYRAFFGKRAVTPLFKAPVPIFPSERADPKKGTGILMVCTFGDATDVEWWRSERLALRQVLGRNGRFSAVQFGDGAFESLDPELATRFYAGLIGKTVNAARASIVQMLRDPAGSATGDGAPLKAEPKPTDQMVKFYEKGDAPVEFITTRQWFVRLLDKKAELLEKGNSIRWHPDFMRLRFANWTENLGLDWCISRQRYFGVPFPVWYPVDSEGRTQFEKPILAQRNALPVDPLDAVPPGFSPSDRDRPGGFRAEPDVFDTWFTSSLTPQIGSGWLLDPARHARLFPADIRPQSHEIIRTWAFYTIAKAMLHEDRVPWHNVVISGWVLDPDRKKMSKSKGNVVTPMHLLDEFSADAVRYWAASARLGTDTAFDPKVLQVGRRLVTKIYNASKFVLQQQGPVLPVSAELDRAFLAELGVLVREASDAFSTFEFARALAATEQFFWSRLTDSFLELSKSRCRGGDGVSAEGRGSAVSALRLGLNVLLRLFAPVLPYITEEVWSWVFAQESGHSSIHRAPWPSPDELASIGSPSHADSFELAVTAFEAINKAKSEAGVSTGRPLDRVVLRAHPESERKLKPVLTDVQGAARSRELLLLPDASMQMGQFTVAEAVVSESGQSQQS
jgi:valyl-tRNA synthetase